MIYNRKCFICGKEFSTTDSRVVCCSAKCKIERQRRLNRENYEKKLYIKKCLICGKIFKTNRVRVVCCSDECQKIRNKKRYIKVSYPCKGYSTYSVPVDVCLNCNKKECRYG